MPGPRAANLERSPGGLPGHVLQSRYPAGRGGRGVLVVAQRRKAMAVPSPAPQDRFPLPRPLPEGAWHVANPRGESFIPSISQRRKLQSVMAQSAHPKSRSWLEPSPDCESEAHGLCRPDLGGSQA